MSEEQLSEVKALLEKKSDKGGFVKAILIGAVGLLLGAGGTTIVRSEVNTKSLERLEGVPNQVHQVAIDVAVIKSSVEEFKEVNKYLQVQINELRREMYARD